jgi:membrane dipeptidase
VGRKLALAAFAILTAAFFLVDLEPRFEPAPLGIEVSERARRLHDDAIVLDLHVDSLLWPRDLGQENQGGHVDFPRMGRGGLDVAAFTVPTRFFGAAGLKALHDVWPLATWFSPYARLRHQLDKTSSWTDADLAPGSSPIRKNHVKGRLSYFHGIEGAHALEGDLSRVSELRRRGVLFIGLVI